MTTTEGIRKRGSSYQWQHSYTGADGKRVFLNGTEKSDREAKKARRASMTKVDTGELTEPTKLTVGQLCDTWLASKQVKPSTLKTYRDHVANQIKPTLGGLKLAKLNAAVIDRAVDKMRRVDGGELSSTSKQHALRTLHACLAYAVRKNLIARNPASLAEKPKRDTEEMNPWTEAEVSAWLTHPEVVGDRLYPCFVLLAHTGCRRGEACGLKWGDIDLDAGRAVIRRSRASVGYDADGDHAQERQATDREPRRRDGRGPQGVANRPEGGAARSRARLCRQRLRVHGPVRPADPPAERQWRVRRERQALGSPQGPPA